MAVRRVIVAAVGQRAVLNAHDVLNQQIVHQGVGLVQGEERQEQRSYDLVLLRVRAEPAHGEEQFRSGRPENPDPHGPRLRGEEGT